MLGCGNDHVKRKRKSVASVKMIKRRRRRTTDPLAA